MPACARKDLVDPNHVGVYHCYSRCVQRAYLCGYDADTGTFFDHRKQWLENLTARLASAFAIDILDVAILDNHMHHVLRTRPDLLDQWSDEQVVVRYDRLRQAIRFADERVLSESQIDTGLANPKLPLWRERLGSLSWFMKSLKEPVARRANAETENSGCFWDGRFRSTRLLDEQAVLACSIYVDLNQVRAGVAQTPEESRFTSAWHRIRALIDIDGVSLADSQPDAFEVKGAMEDGRVAENVPDLGPCPIESMPRPDAWLAPIGGDESDNVTAPRYRASNEGFLNITAREYIELLDWSGRLSRGGKKSIPKRLKPIFERIQVDAKKWTEAISAFQKWFPRVAGCEESVRDFAANIGQKWIRGLGKCRGAFS